MSIREGRLNFLRLAPKLNILRRLRWVSLGRTQYVFPAYNLQLFREQTHIFLDHEWPISI